MKLCWKLLFLIFTITAIIFAVSLCIFGTADYGTLVIEWEISAFASDNVWGTLYKNGNERYTLVISGEGRMQGWSEDEPAPWYSYKNSITEVVVDEGVTTIGNYAFYNLNGIVEARIQNGVTSIGAYAYANCANLERVYVGDAVTSFNSFAFLGCDKINEVHTDNVSSWAKITFINEYANPLSASGKLYVDGTHVVDVILGDNVTSVGSYAFVNSDISSVELSHKTTNVKSGAFKGCHNLKVVKISNTTIAKNCKNTESFGAILSNATTVMVTPEIQSSVSTYIKSNFVFVDNISVEHIDGNSESFVLYSTHSHNSSAESFKATYTPPTVSSVGFDGRKCEICGIIDGKELPCVEALGTFVSSNLTIGSDLTINVFADIKVGMANEACARFTMNDESVTVKAAYDEVRKAYKFSFDGISPQHMTDAVKAELIIKGAVVSVAENCSVRAYSDALLSCSAKELGLNDEQYAAARFLICDMLEYGAMAQIFRGYKTDDLANAGVSEKSEYSLIEGSDFSLESLNYVNGVGFEAVNLRFDHANNLCFRFSAVEVERVSLAVEVNGKSVEYSSEDFVESSETYIFYTDDILATRFDDVYTVTLCYDGIEVQKLTYSVRSYVYSKQNQTDENGDLTEMALLARATYVYGKSAEKYFSLIEG